MPCLIKHIDQVAREVNRDVLLVSFETANSDSLSSKAPWHDNNNFETDVNRCMLIDWLDANNIGWMPIGDVASEYGFRSYHGNIYIDVPFDKNNPDFELLQQHLENEDDTPRNPLVKLWVYSLEDAIKNAHHDAPDFWDKWAETF